MIPLRAIVVDMIMLLADTPKRTGTETRAATLADECPNVKSLRLDVLCLQLANCRSDDTCTSETEQ